MEPLILENYACGQWRAGDGALADIRDATTGAVVARAGSGGLDFKAMLDHARTVGGPALQALDFHERAAIVKALGQAIMARKEELYALNLLSGATRKDGWIDIEGGAGTLFSFASVAKRELPKGKVIIDGGMEMISRGGSFVGQHIYTPLKGAALLINAFNFPIWGMLEKIAPALVAGMPCIVKPATSTAYLAEAAFRVLIETGLVPQGALQLIVGSTGDIMDHLTCQDLVSFTGSADTAMLLQAHPVIARESVRFVAERDSLNACVLGPDATPDTPEFDLFIKEVAREMTVKAGQKCTAIRRAMVPAGLLDAAQEALSARLAKVVTGDPRDEATTMGTLASERQRADVRARIAELATHARIVFGEPGEGPFLKPVLLRADDPWAADAVHDIEAFGPVSTLMPYRDVTDAIALANRGKGSLVMSIFTHDGGVARDFALGAGAFHGRMLFLDRDSAKESTGHGSPLPVLVHGGPGRAGGGEEMGGARGVKHFMQRTALQGSPTLLAAVVEQYLPGAAQTDADIHPFRLRMSELSPGYTFRTPSRTVTLDDIEHFAHFTGDTFYAHMDEEAASQSPIFGGRVAHGYLILSFAAGLFVDPAPGPVLANFGLEGLRFIKPLKPGSSMKVALTVKSKKPRTPDMGEVRWLVQVTDEADELLASYELLTMNAL